MSRQRRTADQADDLSTALIGAALADDSDAFTKLVYEIGDPVLNAAVLARLAGECVGLLHGLAGALDYDGPGQVWLSLLADRA